MSPFNPIFFENRQRWREWLELNHSSERLVWVLFYKARTGIPSMGYEEAVEEAVCFGWIDNLVRTVDGKSYAQRFAPRKPGGAWSATNRRRARRMIAEGRMTPAGMESLAGIDLSESADTGTEPVPIEIPGWIMDALRASAPARLAFEGLPPSTRALYLRWVLSAKKDETRRRRLREIVDRLEKGEPLGMK
ncbi:MAG: hypothetical protein EPN93_17040 [Spirochaetes bacterium]|nr:MAG: hypothetical protein EPN93_17040 [Spirochaetota bacterium]